jgi:hypothetical protein
MKSLKPKSMYIIVAIVVLLLILSRTKFEVRHDITINAPIDEVWKTVIDFPHYSKWNSQLLYLDGTISLNEKIHLKLSVEGTNPYEFEPTVSHWKENEMFAWIAITRIPRIFDGEHFFELQDLGNGKTLLVNREEYRGILSLIMQQIPAMKLAPKGFEKMNVELKKYIEEQSGKQNKH